MVRKRFRRLVLHGVPALAFLLVSCGDATAPEVVEQGRLFVITDFGDLSSLGGTRISSTPDVIEFSGNSGGTQGGLVRGATPDVTLKVVPAAGVVFDRWDGVTCRDGATRPICRLQLASQATLAIARFRSNAVQPAPYRIQLVPRRLNGGTASGRVQVEMGGTVVRDCAFTESLGNDCGPDAALLSAPAATALTLRFFPAPGTIFGGWLDGRCAPGATECTLTVDRSTVMIARYEDAASGL